METADSRVAHRVLGVAFMHTARSLAILAALALTACAGTLPDPIYANQVDAYFPDEGETTGAEGEVAEGIDATPEGSPPEAAVPEAAPAARSADTAHQLRVAAGHCAARLNGHRSTAETVSILQGIIGGIGGVTGGVGSALAVVHFDSPDINTAMGVMGSIGAGITFVGNLILGFVANPLEEARRQGLGLRSWEMAVELQLAHADAAAVQASLDRCTQDLAPETHLVGEGEAYSE